MLIHSAILAPTDRGNRLSLSLDAPASVSPFPSPSSSFIPPPTPGAHEFAIKPPPADRSSRAPPTATPHNVASSTSPSFLNSLKRASRIIYIKIRDFAFSEADERHIGLGSDVPKANKVGRMNRRLGAFNRNKNRGNGFSLGKRTSSHSSFTSGTSSSDGNGDDEDMDTDNASEGNGWDGFRMGLGRLSWNVPGGDGMGAFSNGGVWGVGKDGKGMGLESDDNSSNGFPTRTDLDRNFLIGDGEGYGEENAGDDNPTTLDISSDDDEFFDATESGTRGTATLEGDERAEDEEELYPGVYRALFAFEPEGTAEMRMMEDQIVRVVGRGGSVGWAVVVVEANDDDGEGVGVLVGGNQRHALVPESYLEPVKLDWEVEQEKLKNGTEG